MNPIFEALESEYESITFITIDLEDYSETKEALGIQGIPTFKFFKTKQRQFQRWRVQNKRRLQDKVSRIKECINNLSPAAASQMLAAALHVSRRFKKATNRHLQQYETASIKNDKKIL